MLLLVTSRLQMLPQHHGAEASGASPTPPHSTLRFLPTCLHRPPNASDTPAKVRVCTMSHAPAPTADCIAWLRSKGVKKTTKLHCKQRQSNAKDTPDAADREFYVSCAPIAMVVQVALREAEGVKLTSEQWTLLAMDLMEINEACERRWHDFFGKYASAMPTFAAFVEKAGATMRSFYRRYELNTFLDDMRLMCSKRRAAQQLGLPGTVFADLQAAIGNDELFKSVFGQQLAALEGLFLTECALCLQVHHGLQVAHRPNHRSVSQLSSRLAA